MDFPALLRKAVLEHGDRTAVVCEQHELTYRELYERSCRLANALAGLGVRPGDRVALLGDNSVEIPEQMAGLALGNLVRCGMYTHAGSDSFVYLAEHIDAKALLVQARHYEGIADRLSELPLLEHVIVYDGDAPDGTHHYEALLAAASGEDPYVAVDPGDLHIIRFSAGTTGKPKGICHTSAGWMGMGVELAHGIARFEEDDRYLAAAPMAHAAGMIVWPLLQAGGTLVIMPAFDPGGLLEIVEGQRITVLFLVPTMIQMVVNHTDAQTRDLSSLRVVLYGAAPISERTLADALAAWGNIMYQLYGQSECLPSTVLTPRHHRLDDEGRGRLRSAGRAFPNVELAILDDDGRPVPDGEIGEVAVRSPGAMQEIWKDPDATAARVTADGFVLSRDMGYLDGEGFLFLADRKDDMIISGGFNIWPAELENAIADHPAVLEVAVFGVPDERWGETPMAVVVLREGHVATADELIAHCRERVGATKKVTSVAFADELPKTPVGKVLRRVLREPHWDDTVRVAGA